MKTRLLRKVRKEYEIIKWEECNDPKHYIYDYLIESGGQPIYEFMEGNNSSYIFSKYEDAYLKSLKTINYRYLGRMKRPNKNTKIWYNDKK